LGLSIPIPNAIVAQITWQSSFAHWFCTSCRFESLNPAWYGNAFILYADKYLAKKKNQINKNNK